LEERGFWKILLEDSEKAIEQIREDKEVSKLTQEHANKYGWTTIINLAGEDPSLEQVIDQITHIPAINNHEHTTKTEKELAFLIECAAATGYLRQTGVEYFSIYSRYAMKLLRATAQKLGITYRELLDLNLNEIIAGINGADVKKIIEHRTGDKWAIYSMPDNQEPVVIDNPKILEYLASTMIPKAEASDDGSIKGQIGNKGIGKGKVKVIMSLEDFHKMEKGDVLVTTMTTPDFVPLMQKSVAIITDIGGLLCHAAIISRELNTPCVIGTKFATQLLKDGDLVEVNANQGVVRILE
jgi:phosphoenolpyruvate synthase/pyruvate phosphate dikinase